METVKEIIDSVGAEKLAEELNISFERVYAARYADKLPAAWFNRLETMTGKALPREFFRFK